MNNYIFEKGVLKETKKYMEQIINNLKNSDGEINSEWFLSLKILEENVNTYNICVKQIKEEGLLIQSRLKEIKPNPLFKIKNDVQIQILKLLNEFALTKKSQIKLLDNEIIEKDDSPLNNFMGKKEYR